MLDAENTVWISVEERLPPRHKVITKITDDVCIRFEDGSVGKGFYSYRYGRWYTGDTKKRGTEITHWKEITDG